MNIYDKAFYILLMLVFMASVWGCLLGAGILATVGLVSSCMYLGAIMGKWL